MMRLTTEFERERQFHEFARSHSIDSSLVQLEPLSQEGRQSRRIPSSTALSCHCAVSDDLRPSSICRLLSEFRGLARVGVTQSRSPAFNEVSERWLASDKDLAYSTRLSYRRALDGYRLPGLGEKSIAAILPSDI